jgi:ParB family transcriptional regulator, chromosome partitioning protein
MGKKVSFADVAGEVMDVADVGSMPPRSLPVDQLAANPDNPRGPKDKDLKELADTLREHGLLQPVVVVSREVFLAHFPEHGDVLDDAGWVVINGNRRLAAARLAGLETLEVSVRDSLGDQDGRIDEAVMIENIHRQNLEPLREAEFLRRMVDRPGGSLRTVAKKIGKTHVYVQQRLSLLKLVPELKAALRAEKLGIREARELAMLDPDEQLPAWHELQAPVTPPEMSDQPGGNPVNTPRVAAAHTDQPRTPRITLSSPVDVAAVLRSHFSDDELAELVALLSNRG